MRVAVRACVVAPPESPAAAFVDSSVVTLAPARRGLWAGEDEATAVQEVLLAALQTAIADADMAAALGRVATEPPPLFRQLCDEAGGPAVPAAGLAMAERVLDAVLASILAEAEAGEFSLTARTVTR